MEDLHTQVLSGFGLKAKKIVREKNGYICNTQKGLVLIRKTVESCDHIAFSHKVKEFLKGAGFSNIDHYWLSTKDKPFVMLENDVYVATGVKDFKEINFEDNNEFLKALREVAGMHRLSRRMTEGFADTEIGNLFYRKLDLQGAFSKKLGELRSIKKRVGIKNRLSDFDVMFLKNYSVYENQIQEALSFINQYTCELGERGFCHNMLREESLPSVSGQIHIINFSRCGFMDTSLMDISDMIRRYIRRMPKNPIHIQEVLNTYLTVNRLSPGEIRMLYPMLLYPEQFLKLCGRYYSKKRTWIPNAMVGRIENLVLYREKNLQYVEGLKYITVR